MPSLGQNKFGCQHYKRNCLVVCNTCTRTYPCVQCHDKNESHKLIGKNITDILCLVCGVTQKKSNKCINCNSLIAEYYCDICSFWSENLDAFHCDSCGVCRKGNRNDFIHCDKCSVCIENREHKHISSGVKNNCPICAEYLLYSNRTVILLRCGHSLHKECHDTNLTNSIHCPICFKLVGDDKKIRDKIEMMINANINENHKLEIQFCQIKCFECGEVCSKKIFMLFNQCNNCGSYNTKLMND
ncbi:hypothetical protein H312_02819 [Anncaliia algerae PRA339]|uniref:CHY-type domain-containing protein n=1 Tax=Anncaliia algerae PRA339 TaxID=1288291 RepID=A0A059EY47_9MICR|nr:hypothetical protein H312_02819 [Anncaliia algerae PRA339]